MVSLKAIRSANAALELHSPTVVFVGATSGIGLAAVQVLLRSTVAPRIIIVGRSESKFSPTLKVLRNLNAAAEVTFIEAQVSLLKEVDRVCKAIEAKQSSLDLLWLTQGGLAGSNHRLTAEGLNADTAINIYSRMLFMHLLTPLLCKSADPRVLSILCAGQEGPVNFSDIGLLDPKNDGLIAANQQGVAVTSLAMREMALANPKVTFIHTNPGVVNTDVHEKFFDKYFAPGYLSAIIRFLVEYSVIPLMHLIAYSPEDAGQIGIYELTDERYKASNGTNFFRLSEKGEDAGAVKALTEYEENGSGRKVFEHMLQVFDDVLAK